MWRRHEEHEVKKEEGLLRDLCGGDAMLYDCLTYCMYENPLTAIPNKDLGVLTAEADESGQFGLAVDKAIFEAARKPDERDKYIKLVQDLASRSLHATEQEKQRAEKEGHSDLTPLERIIRNQRLIAERAGDVIDVASKFYREKLIGHEERVRREAREKERQGVQREERKIEEFERAQQEERRRQRKEMGRGERREARKKEKAEEVSSKERREARERERKGTEREEERIAALEEAGRETRRKDRTGD